MPGPQAEGISCLARAQVGVRRDLATRQEIYAARPCALAKLSRTLTYALPPQRADPLSSADVPPRRSALTAAAPAGPLAVPGPCRFRSLIWQHILEARPLLTGLCQPLQQEGGDNPVLSALLAEGGPTQSLGALVDQVGFRGSVWRMRLDCEQAPPGASMPLCAP